MAFYCSGIQPMDSRRHYRSALEDRVELLRTQIDQCIDPDIGSKLNQLLDSHLHELDTLEDL